jgi:hypothetical protein
VERLLVSERYASRGRVSQQPLTSHSYEQTLESITIYSSFEQWQPDHRQAYQMAQTSSPVTSAATAGPRALAHQVEQPIHSAQYTANPKERRSQILKKTQTHTKGRISSWIVPSTTAQLGQRLPRVLSKGDTLQCGVYNNL